MGWCFAAGLGLARQGIACHRLLSTSVSAFFRLQSSLSSFYEVLHFVRDRIRLDVHRSQRSQKSYDGIHAGPSDKS